MKVNQRTISQYILLYILLVSNASAWYISTPNFVYVVLAIALFVPLLLKVNVINQKFIVFIAAFTFSVTLCRVVNNGGIGINYIIDFGAKALIANAAYLVDRENAPRRFINCISIFALISVIAFTISTIQPEILTNILGEFSVENARYDYQNIYYGKLLYTYQNPERNCGIYTEPALYQMVLTSGLYILLYAPSVTRYNEKKIRNRILLLTTTIITTFSATAYISLVVLMLPVILIKTYNETKVKKYASWIFSIIVLVLIGEYIINAEDSILSVYLFEKTGDIGTSSGNSLNSGDARIAVMIMSLYSIIRNPFGIGASGYATLANAWNYTNAAGNGLFYYLMVLGIFGWLSAILYIMVPMFKHKRNVLSFVVFVGIYIIATVSQSYIFSPAILFITLIDLKDKNHQNEITLLRQKRKT